MPADEVLTMGRIGVDLYPEQTGVSLREVRTFAKFLGGSASNVAVAAARYGRRAAVITRTGDDPFGEFLHDALRGFGVDDRFVTPVATLPTPVTFCEIFPPDDFPLYFYRFPKAPDLEIHPSELDLEAIHDAEIFWVTGTGLSQEPSRTATLTALKYRNKSGITVFDLDYRPMFWSSRAEARRWYAEALPYATVAVGNLDEAETAVGVRKPAEAAAALHDAGVELAVVKQGPAGVLASRNSAPTSSAAREGAAREGAAREGAAREGAAREGAARKSAAREGAAQGGASRGGEQGGASRGGEQVEVPPVPVEVVNGLGAGDAFGGALCHGLLAGWELEATMRFANAAGAIVASRLSCADAMPTEHEVQALIEGARHA
ncbi:PfkB family carbohydrate kinase [Actinoplanes sp. CA-054009]